MKAPEDRKQLRDEFRSVMVDVMQFQQTIKNLLAQIGECEKRVQELWHRIDDGLDRD